MTRCVVTAGALALTLAAPSPALAHGLQGRADLPIPAWLFGWAAALVLLVSFVALAVLWSEARLEQPRWRPLPASLGRLVTSRVLEILLGAIGVALLALVVWAGFAGSQTPTENLAPTFVYVGFWLGLVVASLLLGDVFRLLNPWRALGRAFAVAARVVAGDRVPEPLAYPERLGRWPAVVGLTAFAMLELVVDNGSRPEVVALATLLYTLATFAGMFLYGVETWSERGEAFGAYFGLYARLSPWERRGRAVGVRPPLTGLTRLEPLPGTVALLAAVIGSTTFDGLTAGRLWTADLFPPLQDLFIALGLGITLAAQVASAVGLLATILLVAALYEVAIAGARRLAGGGGDLGPAFVHSLVPIALAYVAAHYVTLLLFQGQALLPLASDPLGSGRDLLGTAGRAIDYSLIGATSTWYLQVAFVVAGHVAALVLAHDRALARYGASERATRSQLPMLAVMVAFTALALWLLSQANAE